jgi:hypothetical protein
LEMGSLELFSRIGLKPQSSRVSRFTGMSH